MASILKGGGDKLNTQDYRISRGYANSKSVPGDPFRSANSTSVASTHYYFLISSMCRLVCIGESRISHTRVPPYILSLRNRKSGMGNTDNSVCVCVCVYRGRSRISRRRGRQPSRRVRQHTFLPNFPKNCMQLRKCLAVGRGAPLRSATSVCVCVSKICLCRSATCVSFED